MMLFQEQNEIKKSQIDPEALKIQLDELKVRMSKLKQQKIEEAKKKLEDKKEMLNQEKKDFFKNIKRNRDQVNTLSPQYGSEVNTGNGM